MSKEPLVKLIDYTGKNAIVAQDYAMNILIFAKGTRLEMTPDLWQEIANKPYDEKLKELEYITNTIPSSWEFVDYTFLIQNVSRAFTHQLVRTRTASYAQQTMRTLDVSEGLGWDYATGPTIKEEDLTEEIYDDTMRIIAAAYRDLISKGVKPQDARGILPTNILTNIMMKLNMRNFVDLVRKRSSLRVQDEYREVIRLMIEQVLSVHPWMTLFLSRTQDNAIRDLENIINLMMEEPHRTTMLKLLFQVRTM